MNSEAQRKFKKLFEGIDYSKRNIEKFSDFCTMSAYSIALPFYPEKAKEKLKQVFESYKKEDLIRFDQMFTIMVNQMEVSHEDFLGEIFLSYEMGNAYRGQFFTPYHVSLMMARMTFSGIKEEVNRKGFVTICEPCSGAGCMIIAARQVMIEEKCNPSMDAYVEAIDIDYLAYLMSYIQISLYGMAARVIHGNTLSLEIFDEMFTPVYFLNNWGPRLAVHRLLQTPSEIKPTIPEETAADERKVLPGSQLSLFNQEGI